MSDDKKDEEILEGMNLIDLDSKKKKKKKKKKPAAEKTGKYTYTPIVCTIHLKLL